MDQKNDIEAVENLRRSYSLLSDEIKKVIIGQDKIVRDVIISIFCRGHCLLIGVPGLAKTLLVNTIADVLGLQYNRIQFTPDLMPSDIIGTEILDESRQFRFIKGPLFANFILADEINRTPPKTQSALLEAMQELSITTAGKKFTLQKPFFVLATQNPIEQEGTYPLPEAQLDRFMFNLMLDYPSFNDELLIVKNTTADSSVKLGKIMNADDIVYYQDIVRRIPVNDSVLNYAVTVVAKSRPGRNMSNKLADEYLNWGAGPRASQYLVVGAKANAVLNGKFSPDIEDVRAVAYSVLRHRIIRNYKAEAENVSVEDIISELLK